MDILSYKTEPVAREAMSRRWLVIDANGQVLGRLASQIAFLLRGKHKTSFTPFLDCGDSVVVINAEKVRLTGRKADQRQHLRHTGYPGGQRATTPRQILAQHPERLIEYAVRGMLPKNKLGDKIYGNLYVYAGAEHPHAAQSPEPYTVSR